MTTPSKNNLLQKTWRVCSIPSSSSSTVDKSTHWGALNSYFASKYAGFVFWVVWFYFIYACVNVLFCLANEIEDVIFITELKKKYNQHTGITGGESESSLLSSSSFVYEDELPDKSLSTEAGALATVSYNNDNIYMYLINRSSINTCMYYKGDGFKKLNFCFTYCNVLSRVNFYCV